MAQSFYQTAVNSLPTLREENIVLSFWILSWDRCEITLFLPITNVVVVRTETSRRVLLFFILILGGKREHEEIFPL